MNERSSAPVWDQDRCTLCGACVEACRCHAIEMGEHGPVFHCPETCGPEPTCEECTDVCGCEEVCPEGAIECPFEIVFECGDEEPVDGGVV